MTYTLILEPGRAERHYWRDLRGYGNCSGCSPGAMSPSATLADGHLRRALLQPLLTMLIFTIIFGKVAKLPTEGNAPYALLVSAGLLPWRLFATSLTVASGSLIGNSNLIRKDFFPRLIVPSAAVVVAFLNSFVIS